jgi:hypothetical protein
LFQEFLGWELLCPDFVVFSYRASASLIYRREKKKEMSFVSVTLMLTRVSVKWIASDPSRNPTRRKRLNLL